METDRGKEGSDKKGGEKKWEGRKKMGEREEGKKGELKKRNEVEEQMDMVTGVMGWNGTGLALPPEAISMVPAESG